MGRSRLTGAPGAQSPIVVFARVSPDAVTANQRSSALSLLHHRQADARTGDGGADIDAAHIVMRGDDDMGVAALLDLPDLADIGDDACEHGVVLDREREAFQDIGIEHRPLDQSEARRGVQVRSPKGGDRGTAALADQNRRPVDMDQVRQVAFEKGGMDGGPTFGQHARQPSVSQRLQHGGNIGAALFVGGDAFDLHASFGKRFPTVLCGREHNHRMRLGVTGKLRLGRKAQPGIEHDPQRRAMREPRQAAGQHRIVRQHGSDAHQNGVMPRAQQMAMRPRAAPT